MENLDKIYRLKNIIRFSNKYRLTNENVLEHSYYVTIIVLEFYNKYTFNLEKALKMALLHDIAETILGDIITKPKRRYPTFAKAVKEVENNIIADYFPTQIDILHEYAKQESIESKLVKLADIMSVKKYCEVEISLGNSTFAHVLDEANALINVKTKELDEFCNNNEEYKR